MTFRLSFWEKAGSSVDESSNRKLGQHVTLPQVLVYKPFREKEGSSVHELSNPKVGHPETNCVYKKIRGKNGSKADESSNPI